MQRKTTNTGEEAGVNVTALLDIVFILLIFFIVTATFLREKGLDIATPQNCDDCGDFFAPVLLLAVQEDGFVRVNNVRTINPGSVKPTVQAFLAEDPRGVVLVTANPESESGMTVGVMDHAIDGGAGGRVTLTLQQTDV